MSDTVSIILTKDANDDICIVAVYRDANKGTRLAEKLCTAGFDVSCHTEEVE